MDSKIGTRLHGRVRLSLASIDAYLRASPGNGRRSSASASRTKKSVPIRRNQLSHESSDPRTISFANILRLPQAKQVPSKIQKETLSVKAGASAAISTRSLSLLRKESNSIAVLFQKVEKYMIEEYLGHLFAHVFARLAKYQRARARSSSEHA